MLHDTGIIVWHNVPTLRDIVVVNPQWFADAMARIVNFMNTSISNFGGMTNWRQIADLLQQKYLAPHFFRKFHDLLRFPQEQMHSAILALLEHFEIVYRMRTSKRTNINLNNEQMFFVPSLLSAADSSEAHPSVQFWKQFDAKYVGPHALQSNRVRI